MTPEKDALLPVTESEQPTRVEVELLPCPFCGQQLSRPTEVNRPHSGLARMHPGDVMEDDCPLSGWGFYEHQLTAWNTRLSRRDDAEREGPLVFTHGVAKNWWQAKMPDSQFVSARLAGDGYVKFRWRDADEEGNYSIPWVAVSKDLAALTTPEPAAVARLAQPSSAPAAVGSLALSRQASLAMIEAYYAHPEIDEHGFLPPDVAWLTMFDAALRPDGDASIYANVDKRDGDAGSGVRPTVEEALANIMSELPETLTTQDVEQQS